MFLFFLSVCCSTLSYALIVYFVDNQFINIAKQNIIDVFLHCNIANFTLFLLFYLTARIKGKIDWKIKDTFFSKQELVKFGLFCLPVLSAFYKANLLTNVPLIQITISSMMMPICVFIIASLTLKERFDAGNIKYIILALVGFVVINISKFDTSGLTTTTFILPLIIYLLLDSCGEVSIRYYLRGRKKGLQAVMAEMFIFVCYGSILLAVRHTFNPSLFLNPYMLLVSLCCFLHHILMIFGVRKAKSIGSVEFITFAKPVLVSVWMFLLVGEIPTLPKIIGGIIIGCAVIGFKNCRRHKPR